MHGCSGISCPSVPTPSFSSIPYTSEITPAREDNATPNKIFGIGTLLFLKIITLLGSLGFFASLIMLGIGINPLSESNVAPQFLNQSNCSCVID